MIEYGVSGDEQTLVIWLNPNRRLNHLPVRGDSLILDVVPALMAERSGGESGRELGVVGSRPHDKRGDAKV